MNREELLVDVLVTDAAGFIGSMVAAELSRLKSLTIGGMEATVERIFAADIAEAPLAALARAHPRVVPLPGPIDSRETLQRIEEASPGLIVHLAAVVSGQAEADWDLGMQVNLSATIALVEICRRMQTPPVFLFSSSVAVFSCAGNDTITKDTLPAPRSSYGAQKLMGEILVRDASRKGFIRGRSLRFPTIAVRPGAPNRAASSFASGIIREPLAGQEAKLPVSRDLRLHLASPDKALSYVLRGAALDQAALNHETTITLPGLTVSVGAMLDTLKRIAGPEVAARVVPAPDPAIEAIVASWPGQIVTPRSRALGFAPNSNFDELINAHVAQWGELAPAQ